MLLLYLAKSNVLLAVPQQRQQGIKFHQKYRILLAHIADLSIAVVEVAVKVINASLTQNQRFQCVTPT